MFSIAQILAVITMTLMGSVTTILLKEMSSVMAVGIYDITHLYFHPGNELFLTCIGQTFCLLYYGVFYGIGKWRGVERSHPLIRGNRRIVVSSLIIPALGAQIGMVLLFTGLSFTDVTSFQVFRGTILIFVPIFSQRIMRSELYKYQIIAMCIMVVALLFFALADVLAVITDKRKNASEKDLKVFGDFLIVLGQVFISYQIVRDEEQMLLNDYPPLFYSGCMGFIGMVIAILMLIPMQFIPIPYDLTPRKVMEDTQDAFLQIYNSPALQWMTAGFVFCSSMYYVTLFYAAKQVTSTTAVVFISLKCVLVWFYDVIFHQDSIHFTQIFAFSLFICGICAYNNIVHIER